MLRKTPLESWVESFVTPERSVKSSDVMPPIVFPLVSARRLVENAGSVFNYRITGASARCQIINSEYVWIIDGEEVRLNGCHHCIIRNCGPLDLSGLSWCLVDAGRTTPLNRDDFEKLWNATPQD